MYPKVDFFVGIVLVVLSTIGHVLANRLAPAERGLGAGDWPRMILSVLLVLGAILAIYAYYQYRRSGGRTAERSNSEAQQRFEKGELRNVLILTLTVALYVRLVALLGFILLTPPFLFALMAIFGLRQWIKMGVISVVSTAIIYVLFNNLLLVLLPRFTLF